MPGSRPTFGSIRFLHHSDSGDSIVETQDDTTDTAQENDDLDSSDSVDDSADTAQDDTDTTDDEDASTLDNGDSTPDEDNDRSDSTDDSGDSELNDSDSTDDGDTSAPDEDDDELDDGDTDPGDTGTLTLGNICTGQTSCYNASSSMTCPSSSSADFYGQDAYYASLGKCTPQSFTVQTISSQELVIDNNTGLMWQQTIPTEKYTWQSAKSYCSDLTYAGYSDWRLPTPQEFLTIIDNSKYNLAIDTTYFPDMPSSDFWFWSSSTYVHNTDGAWYVGFNNGSVYYDYKYSQYYVRCVRGATLPTSWFNSSVNGNLIVTDTETGLVWQKRYDSGKTWQEALSYCESLTYAGYSDWRLPNKNELASLVNYEKYDPASDFQGMPNNSFWSSSTLVKDTSYAWEAYFSNGSVNVSNKTSSYHVRCVRNVE